MEQSIHTNVSSVIGHWGSAGDWDELSIYIIFKYITGIRKLLEFIRYWGMPSQN